MPNTAQAALVFLVIILPGFLAQGGYRLGRAVPEHPEGLVAVARVIAMSTLIALIAWKVGGREVYDSALAGTALNSDEQHTYRFAAELFFIPPFLGYLAGQVIDLCARRLGQAVDGLPAPSASQTPRTGRWVRLQRRAIGALSTRLLAEGPTTWDRTWRRLRRTEPFAYARVTTKGGRETIGLVADASRVALSPQPRDLYLEQVLRRANDGRYFPTAFGCGMFIAGAEIESVEWVSHEGIVTTGGPSG